MPRYVLLRHEQPPDSDRASHWDFMLEHEGVLWTWAIEKLPREWLRQLHLPHEGAGDEVPAARLADHRIAYLQYEGEVSGDRGIVMRVAVGEYTLLENTPYRIVDQLSGAVRGTVTLNRQNESPDEWQLSFTTEL